MGAIFGGGSSQPAVIQAPAPIVPVAPSGPQLAPGQKKPGGPIVPMAASGDDPNETYEDRMRRLSRGNRLDILGAGMGGDSPGGDGTGAAGGDAGGGAAAP